MRRILILGLLVLMTAVIQADTVTLRALGASGDGVTDDRQAIEKALNENAGKTIDGEGLVYAVDGSIEVRVDVDLRDLTLKQIRQPFDTTPLILSAGNKNQPEVVPADALSSMVDGLPLMRHDGIATYPEDPVVTGAEREALRAMLNTRTLFIHGSEGRRVAVKLEGVKVLRGEHAEVGMHSNSAGIYLVEASPVNLQNVDISGHGKGSGLLINRCSQVKLFDVHLHDMLWMPYRGDIEISAAVLKQDFGWNNSPIYDFHEGAGRFIRVRVQEQLTGLTLTMCEDVEISKMRVANIGTKIDGKFVAWQADGLTVSAVKNFVMRDSFITHTWEGIDLTGLGVDGFVQENIHITDSFAYGFKYAHTQKNGRIINCTSERSGFKGFVIGAQCENLEFVDCVALETGVDSPWKRAERAQNGIVGFDLAFETDQMPRNIRFLNCRAENVLHPGAMEVGFRTSDRAFQGTDLKIVGKGLKVVGAAFREYDPAAWIGSGQ